MAPTKAPFKIPFLLIFNALTILPISTLNADITITDTVIMFSDTFVYVKIIEIVSNSTKLIINEIILPNIIF